MLISLLIAILLHILITLYHYYPGIVDLGVYASRCGCRVVESAAGAHSGFPGAGLDLAYLALR